MVIGLVPDEEQKKIFRKLIEYYKRLYPKVRFTASQRVLNRKEIGELYYTYAGEETEARAAEKMRMINSAISGGYGTPMIILRKGKKNILIDGHRRARVAYSQGMNWNALIISPDKKRKFGIEEMIMGKVKDLYGK